MITREQREQAEKLTLSPHAALSCNATRQKTVDLDPYRTAFQRDRDRILHCKSFRRLSHKTQVFIAPEGDHYRTRLTHTLEVAQISRSIAVALNLNEDLAEAIALSHDLGHTPFGHTGEEALSECLAHYYNMDSSQHPQLYRHNNQSLRVVDVIENNGRGLNLTNEVRDGIIHHTGSERAKTLEGRIVATADRIAYVNHDIDDALRAGIITEEMLPNSTHELLGNSHSERITTLVNDMIQTSDGSGDIKMSKPIWDAMTELRSFLFTNVYLRFTAKEEEPKARQLIFALFDYYIDHIDEVPSEYRQISGAADVVAVTDYVAGMTDRYATATFQRLFIPSGWCNSVRS
ncbi:MAG: deoxyguanosinetriphosphate triphosphohydrolase [Coriobacteriaceae bacterium]|nr:deoxyguanosinetriphosphate triphosphohydrolase [Coriobacteriaceae bacterium]